jgi:hypothetical protein
VVAYGHPFQSIPKVGWARRRRLLASIYMGTMVLGVEPDSLAA